MSDFLSIAAVTMTLRDLLFTALNDDISGTAVTTRPLDLARSGHTGSQVNLFLYHMATCTARRNMDLPWRVRPGETAFPPLPLRLFYLLTVYYGESMEDVDTTTDADRLLGSHRLLGRCMSILHDHCLLTPGDIQSGLPPPEQLDHPYDHQEPVRISFNPLSLEDVSKMWAGFQTEYRMSAAFEVGTVLIESRQPARTPLPVLTIGPDDAGVVARPDRLPPYPTLTAVAFPGGQPTAQVGDTLRLDGHHLDGDSVVLRFVSRLLDAPLERVPTAATANRLEVTLPDAPDHWPAGVYTVAAIVSRSGETDRSTNELPFALAPAIESVTPNPATLGGDGSVTLSVAFTPRVGPRQKVSLLLGDREIPAPVRSGRTGTLSFTVSDAPTGDHFVRLRVDGLNSRLVDRSVSPPVFNLSQQVTINP